VRSTTRRAISAWHYTLEFIQLEKQLLPAALMEKPLDGIKYDWGFAAAAAAVRPGRCRDFALSSNAFKP